MKCFGRSGGLKGRMAGLLGQEQHRFGVGEDVAHCRVWLLNDSTKLSQ